jgi:hypothetical protein
MMQTLVTLVMLAGFLRNRTSEWRLARCRKLLKTKESFSSAIPKKIQIIIGG